MGTPGARSRSWIVGIAATAVMLVLLSSCGGSSSSSSSASPPASSSSATQTQTGQTSAQFKAALTPVLNQFKTASQGTGAALQQASSQTDSQLGTTFQQLETKWQAGLAKLETLQPPAKFTAAFNRLKSQVHAVKSDLAAIVSAAKNHDAPAAKAASTRLVNNILSAKATATTLTSGAA